MDAVGSITSKHTTGRRQERCAVDLIKHEWYYIEQEDTPDRD
jgi:hypothetical protein